MGSLFAKYVVDTSSFTSLQRTYPRDVFPGAWTLVDRLSRSGVLVSVEDVLEELKGQDDEVFKWAKKNKSIFLPLDEPIQTEARKILAERPNLVDLKRRKSGADPFVIAAAAVYSCAVVTEEKPSGGPPKVKIPDVCKLLGVRCIPVLDMLREEGLRLT